MASAGIAAANPARLEWLQARHCDLVGPDLAELRGLEGISETVIAGCADIFEWPPEFPRKMLVQVIPRGIPQIVRGPTGTIGLNLAQHSSGEEKAEWLTRAFLTRYGVWKRNTTPPPMWLVRATQVTATIKKTPRERTILLRRLKRGKIPSLPQTVQARDRDTDSGWDYLLFRFLKSGEPDRKTFQLRLEQYWKSGYSWTQLSLFFTARYQDLNGAELDLLWRTFVSDALSSETAVCLSEEDSLEALECLAALGVRQNVEERILRPETWFLYRGERFVMESLNARRTELEVLAISIHPYYFNACHSLNEVLLALESKDLEAFKMSVRQWNQDMLDARQLSHETDRLLKRVCD